MLQRAHGPNFASRTMWTGDNLDVLRGLNSGSVDLVYADPPFNSHRRYRTTKQSPAQGAGFRDTWTPEDMRPNDAKTLAERAPAAATAATAAGEVHGSGMKAYLTMMGVRLLELRRVLKPAGVIYIHCDHSANAYLRMLLDAIFGADRFQNEIVWKRSMRSDGRRFGRVHDTILTYSGRGATWHDQHVPYTAEYTKRFYRESDSRGSYMRVDLTGASPNAGESGAAWRGHDPTKGGRHWAPPRTGAYATWIDRNIAPGYRKIKSVHARLDALERHQLIHWPKRAGGWPMLKRYAAGTDGQRVNDVFDDIRAVSNLSTIVVHSHLSPI